MSYAYRPGSIIVRQWSDLSYSPYQLALWRALDDAYYAHANGPKMMSTRQPSHREPTIDRDRFEAWQARVLERWEIENHGRGHGKSRSLAPSDWPNNLWLYLYQRMVAADPLKNTWGDS